MRKSICLFLKLSLVCTSLLGVLFSCVFAVKDGYSHWSRRLLYFTAQSNIWIGLTALALLLLRKKTARARAYLFRYVFTVSITITGVVFCFLLAPFADESYHVWSTQSLFTHVFSPFLAIADFFLDPTPFPLSKRHIFYTVLPPLCYFSVASFLEAFQVDFGRGVTYPYFFINFRSPAGIFGFSSTPPFFIGTFYWIFLFCLLLLAISFLYAKKRSLFQ